MTSLSPQSAVSGDHGRPRGATTAAQQCLKVAALPFPASRPAGDVPVSELINALLVLQPRVAREQPHCVFEGDWRPPEVGAFLEIQVHAWVWYGICPQRHYAHGALHELRHLLFQRLPQRRTLAVLEETLRRPPDRGVCVAGADAGTTRAPPPAAAFALSLLCDWVSCTYGLEPCHEAPSSSARVAQHTVADGDVWATAAEICAQVRHYLYDFALFTDLPLEARQHVVRFLAHEDLCAAATAGSRALSPLAAARLRARHCVLAFKRICGTAERCALSFWHAILMDDGATIRYLCDKMRVWDASAPFRTFCSAGPKHDSVAHSMIKGATPASLARSWRYDIPLHAVMQRSPVACAAVLGHACALEALLDCGAAALPSLDDLLNIVMLHRVPDADAIIALLLQRARRGAGWARAPTPGVVNPLTTARRAYCRMPAALPSLGGCDRAEREEARSAASGERAAHGAEADAPHAHRPVSPEKQGQPWVEMLLETRMFSPLDPVCPWWRIDCDAQELSPQAYCRIAGVSEIDAVRRKRQRVADLIDRSSGDPDSKTDGKGVTATLCWRLGRLDYVCALYQSYCSQRDSAKEDVIGL